MTHPPVYNESMNSDANRMVGALSGQPMERPDAERVISVGHDQRG